MGLSKLLVRVFGGVLGGEGAEVLDFIIFPCLFYVLYIYPLSTKRILYIYIHQNTQSRSKVHRICIHIN